MNDWFLNDWFWMSYLVCIRQSNIPLFSEGLVYLIGIPVLWFLQHAALKNLFKNNLELRTGKSIHVWYSDIQLSVNLIFNFLQRSLTILVFLLGLRKFFTILGTSFKSFPTGSQVLCSFIDPCHLVKSRYFPSLDKDLSRSYLFALT